MSLKITVDDGTREVPICNMQGQHIATIWFRPGDFSVVDRFKDMQAALPGILEPLQKVDIAADGTAETDSEWDVIKRAEAALIGQLNTLLDIDNAAEIFAKRAAFAAVGGKFFCQNIIDAVGQLITQTIAEETEATNAKISKYMPEDADDDRAAADEPTD